MLATPRMVTSAVFLISFFCSSSWANLINNPSFEMPVAPARGFLNFANGSTGIAGWTVVGNEVSIVSGTYSAECCIFPAQDGIQWLDLTGNGSNAIEGVRQTVATTVGDVYTLSFWVGNTFDPGGAFGSASTVNVLVGGVTIGSAVNRSSTTGTQVWQQFTFSFTATSSATTLAFMNGDPATDNENGLDNIVLNGTSGIPGAPEAGTSWLFALGVAGTGLLLQLRRRPGGGAIPLPADSRARAPRAQFNFALVLALGFLVTDISQRNW